MLQQIVNTFNNFLPSKRKEVGKEIIEGQTVTLTPVTRKKLLQENVRRSYATELLDTYYGFGRPYLQQLIKDSITSKNIQNQMLLVVRCLPLLKFFTNSISRVYATQPERRFFLDCKEIIKTPKEKLEQNNETDANKKAAKVSSNDIANDTEKDPTTAAPEANVSKPVDQNKQSIDGEENDQEDSSEAPFNPLLNEDKFIYNDELFEALNNLYNDNIILGIKQCERLTNLLNTTVYKIVTNEQGKVRMVFLPNDSVQIKPDYSDLTKAEQIAFVQDVIQEGSGMTKIQTVIENWTKDLKVIPFNAVEKEVPDEEDGINQAAVEYEKLFDTKKCGDAFAPFVVFRDSGSNIEFWDIKDNDVVEYIKSINMSITELRYLEKFTSFGLKYTVNIKLPEDGVMDPNGIWQLAVENNSVPGAETGKNWDIGEFKNEGRIDEVIKAIIFNMKMLFSMFNVPLDALVSTNSKASAESKQEDSKELFAAINSQRDIWNLNEQNLFKVLQAVHNRDNDYKIPKGIEMLVNYEEKASVEKVADDWMVEIQNNISTALDWLSDKNPDLDRDEVMELLKSNKAINDEQKEEPLNLNAFATVDEAGNMIMPKLPDQGATDPKGAPVDPKKAPMTPNQQPKMK